MDALVLLVIIAASLVLGAGLSGGVLMLLLRWMGRGRQPIPATALTPPLPPIDRPAA
jgi:hypothetical protein